MSEYRKVLSGYVNERQDGKGHYLVITNMSDRDFVLPKGEKVYLNRTPQDVINKHPNVPHYTKDEKIEGSTDITDSQVSEKTDVSNDVPF